MNFRFLLDNAACSIFFCSASEKQDTSFSFVFGRLILSVVYSFSSPSVGVGRGLKRSRQFESCFSKNRSNVRYSWGISKILNQNSVNSEFANRRPKIFRSPVYIFSVAILSFKEILNRLQIQSLRRYQTQKRIGAYFQRLL